MKFMMRLFGFIQWLAALVIAALCISVQIQALAEPDESDHVETLSQEVGFDDLVNLGTEVIADAMSSGIDNLSLVVESTSVTTPGLLLSIILVLSAIYCQKVGSNNRPILARSNDLSAE